jgi:predicted aspartyl protease
MRPQLSLATIVVAFLTSATPDYGQSKPIEVPFEFYKNEVIVQARINGQGPFAMMLDTGTDPSAIDLKTADAAGIKRSNKGQQGSGGGTDRNLAYECKFATVELGDLKATNVAAAALDLSRISERMGRHIDGVLGHSLLNKRIVQFDYPHGIVRFYDEAPVVSGRGTTVKFHYSGNVLIDDVQINGAKAVANLDTGSSGTFDISPRAMARLDLEGEAAKGSIRMSAGYNGTFEHREGILAVIKIGDIVVRDADVAFFGTGTGHDKARWDINIGNRFMKDYLITLDYQKKTVTFEK